jgi:hypothetical protein
MKDKELEKFKHETGKKEKSLYDEIEAVRRNESDRVSSILNSIKTRPSERNFDQDVSGELQNA